MAVTESYSPQIDLDKVRNLDLRQCVVSYDRASDTLMVHFYGRGRPAVSVPAPTSRDRDFVFLRFDPETDELVGLQIEDFLRLYVPDHSELLDLLEVAELRGITLEQVMEIRASTGAEERRRAAIGSLIEQVALAG